MKRRGFIKSVMAASAAATLPIAVLAKAIKGQDKSWDSPIYFPDTGLYSTITVTQKGKRFIGTSGDFDKIRIVTDSYDRTHDLTTDAVHDMEFYKHTNHGVPNRPRRKVLTFNTTESFKAQHKPADLSLLNVNIPDEVTKLL